MEEIQAAIVKAPVQEDAAARAKRLAELVRVRLKEQSAQSGSAQALLYWLHADGVKSA
ncbi:MAG: hypothetical protein ABR906_12620 [Terracidiphilus sp.]